MRKLLFVSLMALISQTADASIAWFDGQRAVTFHVNGKVEPVVGVATAMFQDDMEKVTGLKAVDNKNATIQIYQLSDNPKNVSAAKKAGAPTARLAEQMDAFWIGCHGGKIIVAGNNGRGCAYGLLELSRLAGVSPWVWWGDVVPARQERLEMDEAYTTYQAPSVEYRGIFINDEDWTLRNWAWKHYEKSDLFGAMGPKTYKAVFQLLLRLRANAIWPGMHTGTPGFFTIDGNKEMADSCGIIIGTSHCEPLLRNNVAEWDVAKRGRYNYITNRKNVQKYWIERLEQVAGSEEFFTIGMRGIHDGNMEGVSTKEEKLRGLQQVIDDQRELLSKYINKDVTKIPQVFIPYKEVLQIMESGLNVPEDVTLMWCDDNYGYMTRLSDEEQQKRPGGAGVYYHLSYWGQPHDYMWLTTTQPGLVYSEMKAAYDHNARKLWIVNVHDPKVAAYDLEFFLDLAWDINAIRPQTISNHLERWLTTQFGDEAGKRLTPVMAEFYRLCAIRRPEFMGWTQVELDKNRYPKGKSQVIDTEFSQTEFGDELERYINDYCAICQKVEDIAASVRPELKDAYFAAVEYPVYSAAAMAVKMLEAQKARSKYQGQTNKAMEGREDYMLRASSRSMAAYYKIQQLTDYYNEQLAGGKWKGMMNMMPRELPVFNPPTLPYVQREVKDIDLTMADKTKPLPASDDYVARNACDFTASSASVEPIQLLGHSMNAVPLPKGESLTYRFTTEKGGEATLYTALIPTQPNDKGDLRYSVSVDGEEPVVFSLKEKFRSDYWKKSVLRNQALKSNPVKLSKGEHTLVITALDDHIIVDQWMVDFKKDRKFYVIPVR